MPRAPNRAHRARTMKRRGQGAFEYILMLAGVLLIVILIVLILQANLANTNTGIRNSVNQYQLVSSSDMQKNEVVGLVATTAIMPLTWADNNTAVSGGLLNTVPCSFNYPAALVLLNNQAPYFYPWNQKGRRARSNTSSWSQA